MLSYADLCTQMGTRVLFIGVETYYWGVQDLVRAARNAKAMGFDAICPKRGEGGIKWYGNKDRLLLEKHAVESEGVKYRPFIYSDGPRFGNQQIQLESAVLKEIMAVCDGIAVVDMEVEWNGQQAAAKFFAEQMKDAQGNLIVSTWADPIEQGWVDVVRELIPVVAAWGPMQYSLWLGNQEMREWRDLFGTTVEERMMPEIDVVNVFENNPLNVMQMALQRGHKSVWIWEYQAALKNPNLVHAIISLGAPPAKPVHNKPIVLPHPPSPSRQVVYSTYAVVPGDTLFIIAEKLKLTNWFQDLYIPNRAAIERAAQSHGYPNSNSGALIFAGTQLKYQARGVAGFKKLT